MNLYDVRWRARRDRKLKRNSATRRKLQEGGNCYRTRSKGEKRREEKKTTKAEERCRARYKPMHKSIKRVGEVERCDARHCKPVEQPK